MSNFKNNFSELILLANENIIFKNEEGFKFELVPMSLKNILFNSDLAILLSVLEQEIPDLSKMVPGVEINTHYEFIRVMCSLGERRKEAKDIKEGLIGGLKTILPEFEFKQQNLFIGNRIMGKELFEDIIEIIYKIMEQEKIIIKESDDEFIRREKEAKLRAQRIKKSSKKQKQKQKDGESGFEKVIASIIYEFPQYKIKDLFDLNIYTFNYLSKYVGKIANYEVSKIAAGNGLSKKHKYFTEK